MGGRVGSLKAAVNADSIVQAGASPIDSARLLLAAAVMQCNEYAKANEQKMGTESVKIRQATRASRGICSCITNGRGLVLRYCRSVQGSNYGIHYVAIYHHTV